MWYFNVWNLHVIVKRFSDWVNNTLQQLFQKLWPDWRKERWQVWKRRSATCNRAKEIEHCMLTSVLWKENLAGSSVYNPPAFESDLLTLGHSQHEQWSPAWQPSPLIRSCHMQNVLTEGAGFFVPSQRWRRGEVCLGLQRIRPMFPWVRDSMGQAEILIIRLESTKKF